jgi:hypothetical protein
MKNNLSERVYVSPEINQWTIFNEGVLCKSGDLDSYAGEESDNYQELF